MNSDRPGQTEVTFTTFWNMMNTFLNQNLKCHCFVLLFTQPCKYQILTSFLYLPWGICGEASVMMDLQKYMWWCLSEDMFLKRKVIWTSLTCCVNVAFYLQYWNLIHIWCVVIRFRSEFLRLVNELCHDVALAGITLQRSLIFGPQNSHQTGLVCEIFSQLVAYCIKSIFMQCSDIIECN